MAQGALLFLTAICLTFWQLLIPGTNVITVLAITAWLVFLGDSTGIAKIRRPGKKEEKKAADKKEVKK